MVYPVRSVLDIINLVVKTTIDFEFKLKLGLIVLFACCGIQFFSHFAVDIIDGENDDKFNTGVLILNILAMSMIFAEAAA